MVQFVNDFHGLISPVPKGTPLPLVLLGKVMKIDGGFLQHLFIVCCFILSLNFLFCFFGWLFQSKNALLSTFLFLDQIVWLGRSGIYKVRVVLRQTIHISLLSD